MIDAEHVLNAFLRVLASDRANGIARNEDEYAALWADHEALIRAKFRELHMAADRSASGPTETRLGHYEILELLGRGGQGEVFLARDVVLGRKVALKVLHEGIAHSASSRARLHREGELASRLDHPSLGTVYEAGEVDGVLFLATAYIEGRTLSADISSEGRQAVVSIPVDTASARRLIGRFAQLARGLDAAHTKGILHRDIKPSNIMVRNDGTLVLIDFGLAKVAGGEGPSLAITAPNDVFGTAAYLAPELISGETPADRRTDLFAFGATLYEAFSGRRAFRGPSVEAVVAAISDSEPPRLSTISAVADENLDAIVEHLIDKNPDRRYGSAGELADDLDRVARGEAASVVRLGPMGRLWRWVVRRPGRSALVATTLVGFLVSAVFYGLWLGDRPAVREAERRARNLRRDALLEKATYAMHIGGVDAARSYLESATEVDPDAVETRAIRAIVEIESARGDPSKTRAYVDDPTLRDLRSRLFALAAVVRGAAEEARSALDGAERPTAAIGLYLDAVVSLRIAHRLRGSGVAIDARVLERVALDDLDVAAASSESTRRLIHVERLHAAGHVGDLQRTTAVARAADEICSGSVIGELCLANALADMGELARARSLLERVIYDVAGREELNETLRLSAFVNHFLLLRRQGDQDAILEAATRFDAEFPEHMEGRMERVMALAAMGRLDEAETRALEVRLEGAPTVGADHAAVYLDVAARLAYRRGDVATAVRHLEESIRRAPVNAAIFHRLAYCLRDSDQEAAAAAARHAVALEPTRADSWALLGTSTADEAESIRAFRKAVSLDSPPSYAAGFLARHLDRVGRFAEAKALYARSIDEGYEPSRLDLMSMLLDIGAANEARELAERGLASRPDDPFVLACSAVVAAMNGDFETWDERLERALEIGANVGLVFPDELRAASNRARDLARTATTNGLGASVTTGETMRTLEGIRMRILDLGEAADRFGCREIEAAIFDLLDLAAREADTPSASACISLALDLAERRLERWQEFTEEIESQTDVRSLARSVRRFLAHATIVEFRTPTRLRRMTVPAELGWRRLFESVESLESEIGPRADAGDGQ